MVRILIIMTVATLSLTMAGCASKSANRVAELESRVGEFQRGAQERIENQGRQVATLNQRLEEVNTRLASLDRQMRAQEESIKQVSDYLERYDATWTTFSRLQTEYDNELQRLRDQQTEVSGTLTEAWRELQENLRTMNNEMLGIRNDLRQRIDRTNGDIFRLREQSKEKLDDMTAAMNSFGEALQEVLTLQRSQFQSMTDAYSRSLADIEPYLPEAMLSTLNTPELLISPNPDVQQPTQED